MSEIKTVKEAVEDRKGSSRGWCFTINNYSDEDEQALKNLDVDYVIFGREKGSKKETPHLQCYLYVKNKTTFKHLREVLPKKAAKIQKQKGTLAEAIHYCMKEEDYVETGERPRQGKRTDLDIIKHDIKKNVDEKTIANKYFSQWCQYRRPFAAYRELIAENIKTTLIIYDPENPQSCKKMVKYMGSNSKMVTEPLQTLWVDYYCGKYKYVIVASYPWIIKKINSEKINGEEIDYIEV